VAHDAGLRMVEVTPAILRRDRDAPVHGHVLILRKG
jgi:predicted TPR repeat methyltransferase